MLSQAKDYNLVETQSIFFPDIQDNKVLTEVALLPNLPQKISKAEIRSSLKASTLDGVLATLFQGITGGVLLSGFLLELGASPVELGMLSSMPLLVNLLQPLGAYLADRTKSRHWYSLWTFAPARLLWLILALGIGWIGWTRGAEHQLISLTLAIVLVTHLVGALGSASWLSWMTVLVPKQLRGRYFGFRNSAASLTNLIGVPLLGLAVSIWPGGKFAGYGVILVVGVVLGMLSLVCQFFMSDVNPQTVQLTDSGLTQLNGSLRAFSFLKDANFLKFLLYFGMWSFAVNVSAPFFNLYMLHDLAIDVSVVTIYNSLTAGANMLMLVAWGKLADRIGNRPLLITVGVLVALTPLLWLGTGTDLISLWVWLPLLHLVGGGTWAAIDLCSNNLQMEIAPPLHQSTHFAIAAAVAGVAGAVGITTGGFLATLAGAGSLPGLFVLSGILRLVALLPLFFVQEQRSLPLSQLIQIRFRYNRTTTKEVLEG